MTYQENSSQLIENFGEFYNLYDQVLPCITLDDPRKHYYDRHRDWIERLRKAEFPVAFFGSFSAGKSTVINALLNREVLPRNTKPTTAFPTILRKGSSNRAVIYYLDNEGKQKLRGQLIKSISKAIDGNLPRFPQGQSGWPVYLTELESAIDSYENQSQAKIERKLFEELKQLMNNWDQVTQDHMEVSLNALSEYVEGHTDSLFIDRIEVEDSDIEIPTDIVLTDLPGLSVSNSRHIEFTKNYIWEEAKAFVICMKARTLLPEEEAKTLSDIARNNSILLNRSFWIINQWDVLNSLEKQQDEEYFEEQVRQYNLNVSSVRFFKVSALSYILLQHIKGRTLDQTPTGLQEVDVLSKAAASIGVSLETLTSSSDLAEDLLDSIEEVRAFSSFRDRLFEYLNKEAKDEFLQNGRVILGEMVRNLLKDLEDFDEFRTSNADGENFERDLLISEESKEYREYKKAFNGRVNEFSFQVSEVYSKTNFWAVSIQKNIEKEIENRLDNNLDTIRYQLSKGTDRGVLLSKLPNQVDSLIAFPEMLREYVAQASRPIFEHYNQLLHNLTAIKKDYLPEKVYQTLESLLGGRDFEMRIQGLIDSLLLGYTSWFDDRYEMQRDVIEELSAESSSELQLQKACSYYVKEYKAYSQKLKDNINQGLQRSFKNHVEYLESHLEGLLDKYEIEMRKSISNQINRSEALEQQRQRYQLFQETYERLSTLNDVI